MEEARALIVEDDPSWQQLLREMLEEMGLAVDVATSYEEARAQMRAHAHRLAVVDLSLRFLDPHDQTGLQVLDALRAHDPTCVPILLTGYATVETAVEALTQHGAFTVLRKETFRRREFREEVRKALAQMPPR
ncbi:MAG: response regulator, partial [Chloroflexi bacterium]|nr:response regulator [Chloroflexota bacterium]